MIPPLSADRAIALDLSRPHESFGLKLVWAESLNDSPGLISTLENLALRASSARKFRVRFLTSTFGLSLISAPRLAARSPGLRLALALEIERHCSPDEILQRRLIDLVAFVNVDGAPDIPVEAGVE
jgi:hypothetical protein